MAHDKQDNRECKTGLHKELKLADGRHLKVSNYYGASIKDTKKEAAFSWLRDNGFGDLIKNQVSCSFGKTGKGRAFSIAKKKLKKISRNYVWGLYNDWKRVYFYELG